MNKNLENSFTNLSFEIIIKKINVRKLTSFLFCPSMSCSQKHCVLQVCNYDAIRQHPDGKKGTFS